MFLTENANKAIDATYLYEAAIEANDQYHDLCMKMIKCEHVAIVNENQSMLAEADESFKVKLKKILDNLLKKFLAFIDKIKTEWSKLWSAVLSKFVNPTKLKNLQFNAAAITTKISIDKTTMVIVKKLYENAVNIGSNEERFIEMANSLKNNKFDKTKVIDPPDVKFAYEFLKDRPKMIEELEKLKTNAKNKYKEDLQSGGDKSAGRLLLAQYSSAVNKIIVRINSCTLDAVKICRAASKYSKKGSKSESYSILDMFD